MAAYLRDLYTFCWAVSYSWSGLLTGGYIMALLWFWSTLKQRSLSRKAGVVVALFLLFLAFFHAWREQYQKTQPGLRLSILSIGISPDNPPKMLLTCSISNVGQASVADSWILKVNLGRRGILELNPTIFPKDKPIVVVSPNNNGKTYSYSPSDALYEKTASHPLENGAKATGLLYFQLTGVQYTEATTLGTRYTLECRDVNNNAIKSEYTIKGRSDADVYYPGMQTPTVH